MERRNKNEHTATNHATQSLHRRAEDRASQLYGSKAGLSAANIETLSPETMKKILHQLQVHQIELEMQNEELRRTQWQLDTARLRYFDLYDLAPVGYCSLSVQGLILEANLMAAKLLGWNRGNLVQQPISRFISKTDQDIYYQHRKLLLESSEPQSCELRILNSDGTTFWAHLASTMEKDADNIPVLRMVMSDISERKQSEQTLRESEERYRNLFNSIDEGFCVIEMIYKQQKPVDYCFLEVNPSFEKQTGLYNPQGKRILELVPDFDESWLEVYGKIAQTGEPLRIVNEVKSLNRWFDVYGFRVGGPASRKVAIIFNNITERKLIEAEQIKLDQKLHNYNAELERATDLAEKATLVAEKATLVAEKANRAKSEFLSSMSHELRTPLSAILGFAQLLESGSPAPTPKQKRSVDQILQAGWYLLDLINEILDLALIESGKLSVVMESISLADIMRECRTMVEPQAETRGINLSFSEFETPFVVRADATRLKQVLINLLSNAIKYNRKNGSVVVQYITRPLGRIRICVEDNGEGLTPEKIAQLFQPFNRLGKETSAEEGTGIGLVLTKRLTELMGGTIGVKSTVGKGSSFWVELDLVSDCANKSPVNSIATDVKSKVQAQCNTAQQTLLYVEDNPANLMLIEDIIARRVDLRIVTAQDGLNGIELARTIQPNIILMDINLPGINGISALKMLAEDPLTAHIPVIAVSANAIPCDIEKGLQTGFFRYLTKPIRVNEFMDTLDLALEFAAEKHTSATTVSPESLSPIS